MSGRRWPRYLIEAGIGLAIALAVAAYRGLFGGSGPAQKLSALCDGCFVPGLLMTCVGLLSFCAKNGAFDIFSYGVKSLKVLFTPFGKVENHPRYYDYKQEKEAQRGKAHWSLTVIGLCFLAASLVFLALYSGFLPEND